MHRVLTDKGFALIEMPAPNSMRFVNTGEDVRQRKKNVWTGKISGIDAMPHYAHNKRTLRELMKKAGIKTFKLFTDDFGGRERLFLKITRI
jgi:hypothetical protein